MRAFITLFFCLSISLAKAQKTTWYTKNWEVTDKTNGFFYIPAPKKVKNGYWIVKYYQNGNKYTEGFSTTKKTNNESYEGIVSYYNTDGKLSQKVSYKGGIIDGIKKTYFNTGEVQSLGKFKNGKENGVWKFFYKNGKIKTKGRYKNGEKVGVWKTFYKNVY